MIVRVQSLPARSYFAEHSHSWNQLVYAISGALTVKADGRRVVISPEQAVWLPAGTKHSVGSLMGAEFRSLWVANAASQGMTSRTTVIHVSPLLRTLIVEAASLKSEDRRYADRVIALILDQLRRATPISAALPWPTHPGLLALCETLYADPGRRDSLETAVQFGTGGIRSSGPGGRSLVRRSQWRGRREPSLPRHPAKTTTMIDPQVVSRILEIG
ncbi:MULTISPECIES: AraC family ligand binding domain-containing protein [Bradyrhizobium]|uniref:Cupin domain-containing protein n=1 Tax=Bradyrhizobium brasilense TaxID=1419277 RepID=A0ABY8JBF3_9BRAD|nr:MULTISPECIES: cupin domain-containing protein [Bradyrhizobium]MCP1853165.1 hypothetical protein [Bradyrhizobium sp. USDA 4541]WFU61308.1 cupin domain-containing protein [Bradyrhizobium brasilense]